MCEEIYERNVTFRKLFQIMVLCESRALQPFLCCQLTSQLAETDEVY